MDAFTSYLIHSSQAAGVTIAFILAGLLFEQFLAGERDQGRRQSILNMICMALMIVASPLTATSCVAGINALGGGIVDIRAENAWGSAAAAALFVLVMDFGEYLFHRAQHALAPFWAMHSLHHSDESMNVSTTGRHYWIEPTIKAMTIYPAVGLVLRVDPSIFVFYTLLSNYNYFPHMNLKVSFARYSWILNSPRYHRLHHSRLPEHRDTNFAALFPIFDVIFGTYRAPAPGEHPPTGIEPSDLPSGIGDLLAWPIRHELRDTLARRSR